MFAVRVAGGALVIALCATPAGAWAQNGEEQAQELYQQGLSAYQEGDLERAYQLFTQSLELHPHPFTTLQLGLTAERLGHWVEAAQYLERYLETNPESADRIRIRVDRIRQSPMPVRVRTEPPGALVREGDQILAGTPADLRLPPGTHTLAIEREGFEGVARTIDVVFGQTYDINVTLEQAPTRIVVQHEGEPALDVTVDGENVGRAPQAITVSPATHDVELRSSSGAFHLTVPVEAGSTATIATQFLEARAHRPLRFGLGVQGGLWTSLDVAGEKPPLAGYVRFESFLRLPCSRTCFVISGGLGIGPYGNVDEGGSILFLEGMLGGGIEQDLVGALRLRLRTFTGFARFLRVDEDERAEWWPEQATSTGGDLLFTITTEASLLISIGQRLDIVVTPLSYRYVFADELPGGLSSLGFMLGGSLWI